MQEAIINAVRYSGRSSSSSSCASGSVSQGCSARQSIRKPASASSPAISVSIALAPARRAAHIRRGAAARGGYGPGAGKDRRSRTSSGTEISMSIRPAQGFVARPFGERRIIRRRGGQRDEPRVLQPVAQREQSGPPFAAQMMRLVDDQGHLAPLRGERRLTNGIEPRAVRRHRGRRAAPGRSRSSSSPAPRCRSRYSASQPCGSSRNSGNSRSRHWLRMAMLGARISAGPADPPHRLQPQHGLARSRRGDDVQPAVFEMRLHLGQHACLIVAPHSLELHVGQHRRMIRAVAAGAVNQIASPGLSFAAVAAAPARSPPPASPAGRA